MMEAPSSHPPPMGHLERGRKTGEREGRGERRRGGLTKPGRQRLAELGDAGDGAAAVAVREDGC